MAKKTRNFVFYSGGQERSNHLIHQALVSMMSSRKKHKTMTYIPFCEEGSGLYFGRFKRRYKKFGVDKFHCVPVDRKLTAKDIDNVLKSDAIYLAGGNTFYFLKNLRKSGIMRHLKAYANQGGVLAGLSAGAIMMTPNIHMAAYPPFDPDENEVNINNLKALNLVNFEFFPHYENTNGNIEAMMMYSLISKNPIYACTDGSGIIIKDTEMKLLGSVYLFYHGKSIKLTQG